jgi:UDP-3-O-[3-hydroxymyristoyl] N-acetylglucosamine deacetylase/3-hydroxyacyl-[acyl-carrier-protein] dehydratase
MITPQQTIKRPASFSGIGLHTGNKTTLTFKPASENTGIRFRRIDLPDKPEIAANIDQVVDISRGTSIGEGDVVIHTVEHVLAAIAGLEIDNIIVELNSNEPPVGDGSALPYVEVIQKAGIVQQNTPKNYLAIEKSISYSDEASGVDIVVYPSNEFRITFMVDYQIPALGTQYTAMNSLKEDFVTQYAPARTFCFLHEVEELSKQGLIRGGSLENAVVFIDKEIAEQEFERLKEMFGLGPEVVLGKNGIINGKKLRFKNEPVRHKTLDLIGDLALLGVPLKAHIMAARSGHAANVELVKKIRKEYEKLQIKSKYQTTKDEGFVLDSAAIQKILPHRYPFLLVDKIIDLTPMERVVGIKNVTQNEPFFTGHFPGNPIMPGVLILEAMAQTGGILLLNTQQNPEEKLVYFTGLDKVKFRKPVRPGDQLRFELVMLRSRQSIYKMAGKAFVNGELVCEAELSAAVVDKV